jgi:hypothetical protein
MAKLMAGGAKMPNKFKALSSIGAWVLFIMGLVSFLFGWIVYIRAASGGLLEDVSKLPSWCWMQSAFLLGGVLIALSVCIMILRRKME